MTGNNGSETRRPSGIRRAIRRMQAYGSLKPSLLSQASSPTLVTRSTMTPTFGMSRKSSRVDSARLRLRIMNPDLDLEPGPSSSTFAQAYRHDSPLESVMVSRENTNQCLTNRHSEHGDARGVNLALYQSWTTAVAHDNTVSRSSSSMNRSAQQNRLTKAPQQSFRDRRRRSQARESDLKTLNISEPYDAVYLATQNSPDVIIDGQVKPAIPNDRLHRHSFAVLESPISREQRSHNHSSTLVELSDSSFSSGGDLVPGYDRSYTRPYHPLRSNPVKTIVSPDVVISHPMIYQQPSPSLSVDDPDVVMSPPKDLPPKSNPSIALLNPDGNIAQPQPHTHLRRLEPRDTWQTSYDLEHKKLVNTQRRLAATEINLSQETARANKLAEKLAEAEADSQAGAKVIHDIEYKLNNLEQRFAVQANQVEGWKHSYMGELDRDTDLQRQQVNLVQRIERPSSSQNISELGNNRPQSSIETASLELADCPLLVSPLRQAVELGYDDFSHNPKPSNATISPSPIPELTGFNSPLRVDILELGSSNLIPLDTNEPYDDYTSLRNYEGFWSWDVLDNDLTMHSAQPSSSVEMIINKSYRGNFASAYEGVNLALSSMSPKRASPESLHHDSDLPRALRAGVTNHDTGLQWRVNNPQQDQYHLHDTPPPSPLLSNTITYVTEDPGLPDLAAVNSTYLLGVDCDNSRSRDVVFQFANPRIEAVPAIHRKGFFSVDLLCPSTAAKWEKDLKRLERFDPWSSIPDLTLLDPRLMSDDKREP